MTARQLQVIRYIPTPTRRVARFRDRLLNGGSIGEILAVPVSAGWQADMARFGHRR